MKLMSRDVRMLRDLALSHVLSRDQLVELGYFGSVTRANCRLRILRAHGFVAVLDTPFNGQFIYSAGPRAAHVVGERVAAVLRLRLGSPRFLQHALTTTGVRISLLRAGFRSWRFEAQLRHEFMWAGRRWEVRPDGLVTGRGVQHCIEVDLGHVAPAKFAREVAVVRRLSRFR